jgi:hypothetical protein
MNVFCTSNPCPVILNALCVHYEGANLVYTGINTNDTIQLALQKIDDSFSNIKFGYTFNNGLIKEVDQTVQLGGTLIKNTTISGSYKLTFVGNLQANSFIKTGGTNQQFLLADGSVDSTLYSTLTTLQNEVTNKEFIQLIDVPNSYTGQSGKAAVVNSLETGLEFVNFQSSETTSNITADLTVGGVAAGEVVPAGTNIQELATLLLTTVFYPTFVNPTFSLSNDAGLRETGATVTSFTLTFGYDRGQIVGALSGGIWNPSLFQNFRAGVSSSYTINGTTQPGNTLAVSGYTVLNGSNTFSATVSYLTGPQPLDSKNNNYLTPLPAGTSPTQSTSFTGIYPYFYYKSSSPITTADMVTAIQNGTATKVVASSTGTLSIPYNMSAQYLAVAYPSTSTTKTVYFVTTLDSGAITLVFNPVATQNVNSTSGFWSGISYKIHTSQQAITNSNTTIELRNS